MKIKIILVNCLLLIACSTENHKHDGTYINSILGVERKIILDGDIAKISGSITATTESKIKQFEDRVEYVEDNGNITIYYFLENGDMKVNDYLIFQKVQ